MDRCRTTRSKVEKPNQETPAWFIRSRRLNEVDPLGRHREVEGKY